MIKSLYFFPLLLLCACASPDASMKADNAKANFESLLRNVQQGFVYELQDPAHLTPEEIDAKENESLDQIRSTCIDHYSKEFMIMLSTIRTPQEVQTLPERSRVLDAGYFDCLKPYGLKGYMYVVTDDTREWRLPDYFEQFIQLGQQYQQAHSQESAEIDASIDMFLGAMAASAARQPAYEGNCLYAWQHAIDGSSCGNRAATVRPGGQ